MLRVLRPARRFCRFVWLFYLEHPSSEKTEFHGSSNPVTSREMPQGSNLAATIRDGSAAASTLVVSINSSKEPTLPFGNVAAESS